MSLKEIRLIRILMWILFYLLILFALIFAVVIPAVKAYKNVNGRFAESKARYLAAKQEHDTIFGRLQELRDKNRKAIHAFENPWDEKRFVRTARRYFQSVAMTPIDVNDSDRHFRVYEISARAKMESPQNFYRFLEALPGVPYVVQADFPIAFRSYGKDQIEGVFRIRVYEEKRGSAESNASRHPETKR